MADTQVTGSFSYTLTASYPAGDFHVFHADKEISFWEVGGLAYSVEMTIDGGAAVVLDVAAGASPFFLVPSKAKSYAFRFEGAAGTIKGYAG